MKTSPLALITGASTGIGKEMARIHAQQQGDLVIVARSESKLNALKLELEQEFAVNVTVIAMDLTAPSAARDLYAETQARNLQVDYLINNAGFGGHGLFHERELAKEQQMMQLNMVTLTELTHLYVQGMVSRKFGKVLNVSSTASFIPGPLQAVYYATKAYVTSFSQALSEELKEHNVTVTALCPGPVATEFASTGDLQGVEIFDKAKSAKSVALVGYSGMVKGELLSFNEPGLKFLLNWITPLLPRKLVLKMSRQSMEKTA